jgi:hypothetical protein
MTVSTPPFYDAKWGHQIHYSISPSSGIDRFITHYSFSTHEHQSDIHDIGIGGACHEVVVGFFKKVVGIVVLKK